MIKRYVKVPLGSSCNNCMKKDIFVVSCNWTKSSNDAPKGILKNHYCCYLNFRDKSAHPMVGIVARTRKEFESSLIKIGLEL